jgi:hypothetical protein
MNKEEKDTGCFAVLIILDSCGNIFNPDKMNTKAKRITEAWIIVACTIAFFVLFVLAILYI